ncbi:MAG: ADP-forming succinate--CoA ligase subunit beta [Candidatus Cloacimonadota bacterium]|nr:MAG: ADP-forming succinate--CoA ligase subunit beta [Candidatus Cloacimonadota bacterium]PIE80612.1 MAG: ADP-forming succinate--CoA ligase subunit beta [Candidatus Delongbacteria bacterium]
MNIHEYQAKALMSEYKVPTTKGGVALTPSEAVEIAKSLGGEIWVVKAQIHAGGRGKAGGVKLSRSLEEVKSNAEDILGKTLVTHQTGPEGKLVKKVYVEKGINIEREFYLGMVLDRAAEMPVMMASTEGGVEIEKVAAETPEKIVTVTIDPSIGFKSFHGNQLASGLNLTKEESKQFIKFAQLLYKVYTEKDSNMVEINPLVKTKEGDFLALDAKFGFDDNALLRHPDISEMRDFDEEEPTETEASNYDLSYVKLDGNVGCMVNGAGLAMSTMDIIKFYGGEPANFLDVGGAASAETVAKGFEIILKDPNVKAIFVNIFGGIVRCDRVANGIIEATKAINVKVPIIVRLDGTNADIAKDILDNSTLNNIISADDLADGAKKSVKVVKGDK